MAIKELLDRGYGKATQPIEAEMKVGATEELRRLLERHDGESAGLGSVIEARRGSSMRSNPKLH